MFCDKHPRKPLPCAHCLSLAGKLSKESRAAQDQIIKNERIEDEKKRRMAVAVRIRSTFPSAVALLQNNDTTSLVLVLKHGENTRKRKEVMVGIDDKCPEAVRVALNELFSDGGHVDKVLKRAYRRSRGEEESDGAEEEENADEVKDVNEGGKEDGETGKEDTGAVSFSGGEAVSFSDGE